MLKHRVITGLALLAVIIAVLFFTTPAIFNGVLLLFFAIAAWEWANLAGIASSSLKIIYALIVTMVIALFTHLTGIGTEQIHLFQIRDILGAGCTWWAVALLWVIYYPASVIYWRHALTKMLMGLFVLVPAALALIYLASLPYGSWLFIYVVGIVTMADVGAYIIGRWLGKGKLAPHVSPGKSWAGFWGGLVTSLVYAAIIGSYFDVVSLSHLSLVIVTGIASLASVLGDLLESMLKRERGIKDSSNLLPGHGGFMDRMDSLTAAAPVFTLLAILLQVAG